MEGEEQQLETFLWRGQTRYLCPSCSFDGPTELDVLRHWQGTHQVSPAMNSGPTLFDAEDRPIEKPKQELYVPPALRNLGSR